MIVDTIENISRYAALGGDLALGLEHLREACTQVIPDGRYSVSGDAVYATASTYVTEPKSAKQYEAHDNYIDIQYLFQGEEALYWAPRSSLTVTIPYSDTKDMTRLSGAEWTEIRLVPGVFVVLFPWDGHMPGCALHAPSKVRKLVIKALVS
jgi:biofilm protein TabA